MASEAKNIKVWIRFEAKTRDGSVVKLRIQDLPKNRIEELFTFMLKYFIKDESMHKVAGIYKSQEATGEYKHIQRTFYELNPPQIAICCFDNDDEEFEDILALSVVQCVSSSISLESALKEELALHLTQNLQLKVQTKELKALINMFNVLPKFPQSLKDKYENYYEGRGIIVRPDYRGMGIASQIVRQRRMLCDETNIPLTNAWMTSIGSQKAAERNGWKTTAEISVKELGNLTGLEFGNSVPIYKLMMAMGYQS